MEYDLHIAEFYLKDFVECHSNMFYEETDGNQQAIQDNRQSLCKMFEERRGHDEVRTGST